MPMLRYTNKDVGRFDMASGSDCSTSMHETAAAAADEESSMREETPHYARVSLKRRSLAHPSLVSR